MKWFKHDSDSHIDDKLEQIILDHGAEGYGIYWYCLELIAGKIDKHNLSFELKHDARIIGRRMNVDTLKVEQVMKDMVNLGLFENSQGRITCMKLARRLEYSTVRNPQLLEVKKSIMKNHEKSRKITDNRCQTRLDKTRLEENKSKSVQRKRFTPPTKKEILDYCTEKGYHDISDRFLSYYESNGWKVGKNKMVNWKSAVSGWVSRDIADGKVTPKQEEWVE